MSLPAAVVLFALVGAAAPAGETPPPPPACADDARFHALDFWIGEWDVWVGATRAGTNTIAPVLDGCAVEERWVGAGAGEGRSLFYVPAGSRTWKQVWVTARALAPGGVKEKAQVEDYAGPGLRFQGELPRAGGGTYLDRTTLVPLDGGRVRQTIEVSGDGRTWRAVFDAVYVPKGQAPPSEG